MQVSKEFHEQVIRDKVTFSCTDDHSKFKLYDQGADLKKQYRFFLSKKPLA